MTDIVFYSNFSFQSTLPREERLYENDLLFYLNISIHAPTRGATVKLGIIHVLSKISIHAPTRGATATASTANTNATISIHAPTRGATGGVLCLIMSI